MADRHAPAGYRQADSRLHTIPTMPVVRPILAVALLLTGIALLGAATRAAHLGHSADWLVALALATLFVARGLRLGRPITLGHVTAAMLLLTFAEVAYRSNHHGIAFVAVAASGFALVLPQSSRPQPDQLPLVAALVARTNADPLAPFAMHSAKSYFFNVDRSAVIAYRARFGIAAVSGDPVGERSAFGPLIGEFSEFAAANGWRVAVLGASPALVELWQSEASEHRGLLAIPIGRDVVLDVDSFAMVGRHFRNLRQAVSRTRNFGVTTEFLEEAQVPEALRSELMSIVDEWHAGHQSRGFSMILDHLLDGRHPGMLLVLARTADGRVAGFQRYGRSDNGHELSLDVPWRRKDAPNGLDERMIIDLVEYAREHDIQRISLAFAAFPELFADKHRGRLAQLAYYAVHLGDPLIRLESLYRFLRKFHALADQRFVLTRVRELLPVALTLLVLEFVPHRGRRL